MSRPWLARYCHPEPVRHVWTGRVNAVGRWSAACDGRTLVAVEDGGAQEWPPGAPSAAAGDLLGPHLANFFAPALVTSLRALWLWCEAVRWEWCESCGGRGGWGGVRTGSRPPFPCPDCTGGRWLPDSPSDDSRGVLAGVPVDRSQLAWALAPELGDPESPVRVAAGGGVLYLDGGGWRVVQMGLDPKGWLDGRCPTFHADPVFAELWVDRGDPAGRMALCDWLVEAGDPFAEALREGAGAT